MAALLAPVARAILLPPAANLAEESAQLILARHARLAPDFSQLTLITPTAALFGPLRAALLRLAGGAMLAPRLTTLRELATPQGAVQSRLACVLRLAEALGRFRFLFPGQVPLRVAEALYVLFDELLRQRIADWPDEAALLARLQAAYGVSKALPELSREAQIIHRLLRALQEELGSAIPAAAEGEALHAVVEHWPANAPLLFIGFDELTPTEVAGVSTALTRLDAVFITQGRLAGRDGRAPLALLGKLNQTPQSLPHTSTPRSQLLDAAYADTGSAYARAAALRETPLALGDLALVAATDPEHEAQCADLAVRQALLAGAERVAVVCNDRRLARRLRARLERAHISLSDRGGWALSTSRAAATLDAWLDCVKQDFPFRALFAVLKSGYLGGGSDWADALEPRAWRHRIASGAARWREVVEDSETARYAQLLHASRAIETLSGAHPAGLHADGLIESLQRLGFDQSFAEDSAGARVLARLHELRSALGNTGLKMQWSAFRALLDNALEDASFPSAQDSSGAVQLYTLDQTQGLAADAVILTGATPALFAGAESAFFNAAVRRELGLPTRAEAQALALARLRRVLEAAPCVRLLYAPEQAGEQAQLAAPLLALAAFAAAAGSPIPVDTALVEQAPHAEIAVDSVLPVATTRAAPAAVPQLLARKLSAHGHQTLIDCPYAFHARYALGLERLKQPDAPLDSSDYGQRVHRILHAFEYPLDGLPPPYDGPRNPAHCGAMAAHLQAIAAAVFAADLALRPLARFWQQAFAESTPWLAEQLASWPEARIRVECELAATRDGWSLRGRADRIEDEGHRLRIVDYKTGTSPKPADLISGEAVQLPHYALMASHTTEIEYWNLKDQKALPLAGDVLSTLTPLLSARLAVLATAMERGAALPAHGAEAVCEYCDFVGVCRKQDLVRG